MSAETHLTAAQAADQAWDVIIIGAGMGGCAAAFALARAPLNILILEKGEANLTSGSGLTAQSTDEDERMGAGKWPTQLTAVVNGKERAFWPPLGCGVGGSTQLYAAALDRFRPSDFAAREMPDGRQSGWPISYDTLEPYYQTAEEQLQVSGTTSTLEPAYARPLPPPPPMSDRDAWFFDRFEKAGLHPYRQHCGVAYKDKCNGCLGQVCPRDCKKHAENGFLAPALTSGRVRICPRSPVQRINAQQTRADSVTVLQDGHEIDLTARVIVVANGAYFAPVLLLNSTNDHWPDGLANQNDQVGRNLMFHSERRLALWSRRNLATDGIKKSIAVRDFYDDESGEKFGEFQATGLEARYGNVIYALRQRYDMSAFANVPLLRHFLRIPALVADRLLGGASIFALITEDYPYPQNRVRADPQKPSGMRFEYQIPKELITRTRTIEARLNTALSGLRKIWLSSTVELNYGHPCGTCRMGEDPKTSVVDGDGKVHGMDNLYIACGSTFATSGGTNPSLTIAALGLRIGEQLGRRLTGGGT